MAFLPGEPIAREIPLLFFFPGRPTRASHGGTGFRCEDQSRIAGVCREIRCLAALELTLCSSWRQDEFFLFAREVSRGSEPSAGLTTDTALHTGPSRCGP